MTPEGARNLTPRDIVVYLRKDGTEGCEHVVVKVHDQPDPLVQAQTFGNLRFRSSDYFHPEGISATGKRMSRIRKFFHDLWWRL